MLAQYTEPSRINTTTAVDPSSPPPPTPPPDRNSSSTSLNALSHQNIDSLFHIHVAPILRGSVIQAPKLRPDAAY